MKSFVVRVFAALVVFSMVAAPFQTALADDLSSATPISESNGNGDGGQSSTESETPSVASPETGDPDPKASQTLLTNDDLVADDPAVQPLAAISDYSIGALGYDSVTGNVTIPLIFFDGFSGLKDDSLTLNWYGTGGATFELTSFVDASSSEFDVQFDAVNQSLTLTLADDLTVTGGDLVLTLVVRSTFTWNACPDTDAPSDSPRSAWGQIFDSNGYPSNFIEIPGEPCPGTGIPRVMQPSYSFGGQSLFWNLELPDVFAPNAVVTITYQPDRLVISPQSIPVYARYRVGFDSVQIGTMTVANGVITITFNEASTSGTWERYINLFLPASLVFSCDPDQVTADIDEMTFEADPGGIFVQRGTTVLCNAASPTKSGAWSTDEEGNDIIVWTIDSGDLFDGGSIVENPRLDTGEQAFAFDCDSLQVELLSGVGYDTTCYPDYPYYFEVNLHGDTPVRAIVTINASPKDGYTSYVNCASVYSSPQTNTFAAASTSIGWGGFPCFELFLPDGGDFITKSVDKDVAQSGDTVTYNVVAETTSSRWSTFTLTDVLPAGFDLDEDSVDCVVEPAVHASDDCFTYTDSSRTLQVVAVPIQEEQGNGGVKITLTFSGTVSGVPGAEITNEACSLREMGSQGLPIGGEICDDAVTRVIAPPATETPTPSPTATTPASPEASPTTTVEPTATTGVTGLPNTGSNSGSGNAFQFMAAALVATVVVAALGIRAAETRK